MLDHEDNTKYEKTCITPDKVFENTFHYTVNGRIRITSMLEKLNAEIRRREKVILIFHSIQFTTRPIVELLKDQSDNWIESSRAYIKL